MSGICICNSVSLCITVGDDEPSAMHIVEFAGPMMASRAVSALQEEICRFRTSHGVHTCEEKALPVSFKWTQQVRITSAGERDTAGAVFKAKQGSEPAWHGPLHALAICDCCSSCPQAGQPCSGLVVWRVQADRPRRQEAAAGGATPVRTESSRHPVADRLSTMTKVWQDVAAMRSGKHRQFAQPSSTPTSAPGALLRLRGIASCSASMPAQEFKVPTNVRVPTDDCGAGDGLGQASLNMGEARSNLESLRRSGKTMRRTPQAAARDDDVMEQQAFPVRRLEGILDEAGGPAGHSANAGARKSVSAGTSGREDAAHAPQLMIGGRSLTKAIHGDSAAPHRPASSPPAMVPDKAADAQSLRVQQWLGADQAGSRPRPAPEQSRLGARSSAPAPVQQLAPRALFGAEAGPSKADEQEVSPTKALLERHAEAAKSGGGRSRSKSPREAAAAAAGGVA